jgi:hypothetical protein
MKIEPKFDNHILILLEKPSGSAPGNAEILQMTKFRVAESFYKNLGYSVEGIAVGITNTEIVDWMIVDYLEMYNEDQRAYGYADFQEVINLQEDTADLIIIFSVDEYIPALESKRPILFSKLI